MPLDRNDLLEIKKIVDTVVVTAVNASEERMTKKIDGLDKKINVLDKKIDSVKDEIIDTLTSEIDDLAEINQAVFNRIDNIETRVERLEARLV